ncbi:MAG: efflux RND transporter periplasmic adaptor subunit [Flavobacteriales bacterium]|nr:efflux RND transporter periplasmic adaptor subunit [Flavobacteriales bacterium]
MKNRSTYIIAGIALLLGFFAAWMIKPKTMGELSTEEPIENSIEEIWTCSMHPQIRQNEPGQCPICGMDLIPLDNSASSNSTNFEMTEAAIQYANIQTTIVGNNSDKKGGALRLNGRIKPDETLAASIVAHVPGRIEQLYISFTGEEVRKGQKIASIYSPELITAQRELIEMKKLAGVSPALLEASKNKLKYWKISESQIESILKTEKVLENFTVYADQNGIVNSKKINIGDYIKTGQVLFEVQNLKRIWVLFDAYEADLSSIKIGDMIDLKVNSIPTETFSAKVTFIDPTVNAQTRVSRVRAELNNSTGRLKPEMFVQGILQSNSKMTNEVIIPKSSVLWTGVRSVVYVKVPETEIPSFEYREVLLGPSKGDAFIIESGLEIGEEIVTNGAFVIDASAQLNNRTSMMNRLVTKEVNDQKSKTLPDHSSDTPSEFREQLGININQYLQIKDDLIRSENSEANEHAKLLVNSLDAIDMSLLKGKAHVYWMENLKAIKGHSRAISTAKEIEEQRQQFGFLSQQIIDVLKVFGLENGELYVQHCPMANDNKGADWISKEIEIRNPYFGEKMLKCGTVSDTISPISEMPIIEQGPTKENIHNH